MTDVIQERIESLEQRLVSEPQSPLFARLASYYLQAGRASDALRICDDGLAIYPFYSTAHLVKGKALIELGMMAEAKHEYEVVHELLPTNETIARLASSLELGSSGDLSVAPAGEFSSELDVIAAPPEIEELVVEEPHTPLAEETLQQVSYAVEEPVVPAETAPGPELPESPVETAEPLEATPIIEDPFGFQTPPMVEEVPIPPSGYETPDFGVEEKLQPIAGEADSTVAPEAPTIAPAVFEESQTSATDHGFSVPSEALPVEPVAAEALFVPESIEPQPSLVVEDAFGVPIETPPAPPVVERAPFVEPPVAVKPPAFESTATEVPPAKEDQTPDWFDAFSQLQQPDAESTEAPPAAPAEDENPFAIFGTEQAPTVTEAEPYEEFAARMRMELFGTEDTVTLDQYLGPTPPAVLTAAPDQIGELAEKLKSSPRITPPLINYSEKESRPATEGEAASSSGFVTPTLAEIYVKQGWFDDAIKAYRALVVNKPTEKEKFEQRIAEIEEMKKKQ